MGTNCDFLATIFDTFMCSEKVKMMKKVDNYLEKRSNNHLAVVAVVVR